MIGGSKLEELYLAHESEALRLAYLLVGSHDLARDLTHDAFIRCARRLGHLRHPESFWPYLRRTILNLAKMHFRRKSLERSFLRRIANREESHEDPDVTTRDAVERALLQLPLRQRTALVLRFYEDLPEREIAEILGCAPGTARSLISRGLARLRQVTEE